MKISNFQGFCRTLHFIKLRWIWENALLHGSLSRDSLKEHSIMQGLWWKDRGHVVRNEIAMCCDMGITLSGKPSKFLLYLLFDLLYLSFE